MQVHHIDVDSAFVYAPLKEVVYMHPRHLVTIDDYLNYYIIFVNHHFVAGIHTYMTSSHIIYVRVNVITAFTSAPSTPTELIAALVG